MKVAIVGGGVSGITLSILLADFFDVTVFEKNNRILKKLLVTGNGRCNFSNEVMTRENFHGNDKFLDEFINFVESQFLVIMEIDETHKDKIINYLKNRDRNLNYKFLKDFQSMDRFLVIEGSEKNDQ